MPRKYNLVLALIFLLIFIVALALTIILIGKYDKQVMTLSIDCQTDDETVRFELIKLLLQLIVIILFGGIIFKLVDWGREQALLRSSTRADFLDRLGKIYRAVKLARRELRVGGLTTRFGNAPNALRGRCLEVYDIQMKNLNQAQLDLEGLKIEAEHLPAFISSRVTYDCIKAMEGYLRHIVGEYEKYASSLNSSGLPIRFLDLTYLKDFTGPKDPNRRFVPQFAHKYRDAVKSLM